MTYLPLVFFFVSLYQAVEVPLLAHNCRHSHQIIDSQCSSIRLYRDQPWTLVPKFRTLASFICRRKWSPRDVECLIPVASVLPELSNLPRGGQWEEIRSTYCSSIIPLLVSSSQYMNSRQALSLMFGLTKAQPFLHASLVQDSIEEILSLGVWEPESVCSGEELTKAMVTLRRLQFSPIVSSACQLMCARIEHFIETEGFNSHVVVRCLYDLTIMPKRGFISRTVDFLVAQINIRHMRYIDLDHLPHLLKSFKRLLGTRDIGFTSKLHLIVNCVEENVHCFTAADICSFLKSFPKFGLDDPEIQGCAVSLLKQLVPMIGLLDSNVVVDAISATSYLHTLISNMSKSWLALNEWNLIALRQLLNRLPCCVEDLNDVQIAFTLQALSHFQPNMYCKGVIGSLVSRWNMLEKGIFCRRIFHASASCFLHGSFRDVIKSAMAENMKRMANARLSSSSDIVYQLYVLATSSDEEELQEESLAAISNIMNTVSVPRVEELNDSGCENLFRFLLWWKRIRPGNHLSHDWSKVFTNLMSIRLERSCPSRESTFQKAVEKILRLMYPKSNEFETEFMCPQTLYSIDFLLTFGWGRRGRGRCDKIAIEVDGPCHFTRDCSATASTRLKRKILALYGYKLISITHLEWRNLPTDISKRAFIVSKINDIVSISCTTVTKSHPKEIKSKVESDACLNPDSVVFQEAIFSRKRPIKKSFSTDCLFKKTATKKAPIMKRTRSMPERIISIKGHVSFTKWLRKLMARVRHGLPSKRVAGFSMAFFLAFCSVYMYVFLYFPSLNVVYRQ